jgi:hypothetical protein
MSDNSFSIFNSTLPTTTTTQVTDYDTATTTVSGLPSYINVTINNGGLLNGVYDAWCVNSSFGIVRGTYTGASIYSSYGVIPTGILLTGQQTPSSTSVDPYLDKLQQINWILNNITETSNLVNNKYRYNGVDYTWGDVQLAIWQLLGETNILDSTDYNSLEVYSQQNANNLVSLAQANGSNFVPVAGQDFGVIVKADRQQPIILEVKTAGIGDFVWEDLNANGIQDANEAGINGATVKLLDANGNVVGTTTTGDNPYTTAIETGYYQFGPLLPGTYKVQFTLPTGYNSVSPYLQGSNFTFDSDANPANNLISQPVTLVGGQVNNSIDAGFYKLASLGDFVWEDKNGNGIQDAGEVGIDGVNVTLTGAGADGILGTADDTTAITTTDANGLYSFTGLTPGVGYQVTFSKPTGYNFITQDTGGNDTLDSDANVTTGKSQVVTLSSGENNTTIDAGLFRPASIGDFVWEDKNGNGVQDAGEGGIAGVEVNLTGAGADGVIGTADDTTAITTTDANGLYSFTGLTPGVGYQVTFSKPTGYNFTTQDAGGNDALDSDANVTTGKSQVVTLSSGENNTTIDAGLFRPASIGDFVWEDSNKNGIQDAGEGGIAGVEVNLIGIGADGILGTADDNVVTTTTDTNGKYLFDNLAPGNYQVEFVAPVGYTFSPADRGLNDALDSDANQNGLTSAITVASGTLNRTIDAGLFLDSGLTAPGARTPGFWVNHTEVWNGDASDDTKFVGRTDFPIGDILLSPYSKSAQAPKVLDPVSNQYQLGILIGDYNRDGITNSGEKTIFYTLKEAQTIVGASNKVQQDKRYTLDRSLVASWLNYLAGNPAPNQDINNGIAWIQANTPDETGDGIGDGNLVLGASTYRVPASDQAWSGTLGVYEGLPTGSVINNQLDYYNNFGLS